jgi:hypothetical protein
LAESSLPPNPAFQARSAALGAFSTGKGTGAAFPYEEIYLEI